MDESSGLYEVMFPIGWVGGRPADELRGAPNGHPLPADWTDVVVSQTLACGIGVVAERRGFTVYDFSGWPPGVARPPGGPALRTVGSTSEAAKPAVIQRLRVVNSHIVLMHAAIARQQQEVTAVQRVNERDLYRLDYPDESDEPFWYQPLGNILPASVTAVERQRFGEISAGSYAVSLRWLDTVVAVGATLLFDLVNQAMAALGTFDYALAVVSGWTVCELRLRALFRSTGGSTRARAFEVTRDLQAAGVISPALRSRLDVLRDGRNAFLHSGTEPDEATAVEAVALAAVMVQSVVPSFAVMPGKRLLLL